jgi:hypothetical protein
MPISGRSNPQSAFAAQESPRFRRNIAAIGDARVRSSGASPGFGGEGKKSRVQRKDSMVGRVWL